MQLPQDIQAVMNKATCLYTKAEVEKALDQMAEKIDREVAQLNPIFICVVVGGMVPLGQLLTRLNFPLEVDYMHATRYRGNTSGADLIWKAKNRIELKDRVVVIVEDILDTGLTLKAIVEECYQQGARKVYTAALVDKKDARDPYGLQQADFIGLNVDNLYVFGYGMDYKEYLRNAPGIYAVASEYQ